MVEDKKLAEKMVLDDMSRLIKSVAETAAELKIGKSAHTYSEIGDMPLDDGSFVHLTIGVRDRLTRPEARAAGRAWKQIIRHAPNSPVYLGILGYDKDPRELWEIGKVAKYVRLFAHYADIADPMDHQKRIMDVGVGFLMACGVPSERAKVTLPPKTAEH